MTDTNQASELYDLCKRVYELTSWKDTYSRLDDGNHTIRNEGNEVLLGSKQVPLYTSDYLLEKLPEWTELKKKTTISYIAKRDALVSYSFESGTPLLALLKLTIALLEAGRIK